MSGFGSFSLSLLLSVFSLFLLSSAPSVLCHVSFSPNTATENAYTFFVMSVPHGCGANGTTKLIATFPPYITAITLERQVYYEMEKKQIVDPADGLTKWRCEWTGVSGVPALPHDQIQRLGFQVKTPVITNTGLVTTSSGVKQMVMPVKQLCEGDTFSDWTITVTIVPAAGTATTTTPAPAGTTTTASPSPHNHDDHDMVAAGSWTSSDKLSVASLVLCSIMFISTLVLFHKSSYACMTISNDYNSNNNSNTNTTNTNKHMSTNGTATKDVTIELEEKANANGAV